MNAIYLESATIQFDIVTRILMVTLKEGFTIDMEASQKQYEASQTLTGKQFYGVLVIAPGNIDITKEAREFGSQERQLERVIATAICTQALATRILGNFFIRFNQPVRPYRLFTDKEQATIWLQQKIQAFDYPKL